MKLSELKSIIRECLDELYLDESGPADRYRKKHGKLQDTGKNPLENPRARNIYYDDPAFQSRLAYNNSRKGSGIETSVTKQGIMPHIKYGNSGEPVYIKNATKGYRIKRGSFRDMAGKEKNIK